MQASRTAARQTKRPPNPPIAAQLPASPQSLTSQSQHPAGSGRNAAHRRVQVAKDVAGKDDAKRLVRVGEPLEDVALLKGEGSGAASGGRQVGAGSS